MIASALNRLGVPAEVSGRNDILVNGAKVSGNAYQLLSDRSIVHGTLLYNSDFSALEKAITPSSGKLARKGVSSVRQRVTNLIEHLPATSAINSLQSLVNHLSECVCGELTSQGDGSVERADGGASVYVPTPADLAAIEKIELTYLDPAFLRRPLKFSSDSL